MTEKICILQNPLKKHERSITWETVIDVTTVLGQMPNVFLHHKYGGQHKPAYVHDDDYQEANPYFSVLVGDIVGSDIQNVKPIYQHKITSKKVSEGTAIYCLFWDLFD